MAMNSDVVNAMTLVAMDNTQAKPNKRFIIIPACDEEKRLGGTLNSYASYFSKAAIDDFEIMVVCNGCHDTTPQIAEDFSRRFPQIKVLHIPEKIGKGGALKKGMEMACGDTVAFVDADGSITPNELHRLINEMGDVDVVIGSRWLPGANILVKQSLKRRITSRGFNLLVRLLLGLPFKDTQCSAKAFTKRAIDEVVSQLQTNNFAFDVELLYRLRKNGHQVKEVPTTWENKDGSTLSITKAIPTMLFTVVRLRLEDSRFKRMVPYRNHIQSRER